MIERVSEEMEQRLRNRLDNRLVGFGRAALDDQPRRLSHRHRHLAHMPGKALESMTEGKDAQAEHGLLQVRHEALEQQVLVLQGRCQVSTVADRQRLAGGMPDGVLGDGQFAGEPDQRIDASDVDPQSRFPPPGLAPRRAPARAWARNRSRTCRSPWRPPWHRPPIGARPTGFRDPPRPSGGFASR
jgi:hypothetical protein